MDAKRKYAIKDKCPHFVWKFLRALYRKFSWLKCRIAMAFSGKKMTLLCPCCGTKIRSFIEGDYKGRPGFYDLSLRGASETPYPRKMGRNEEGSFRRKGRPVFCAGTWHDRLDEEE